MGVQAQRSHAETSIELQRLGQLMHDRRLARSLKIHKENRTAKCGCEKISVPARDGCHGARPTRRSEGKEELSARLERCEPCWKRMRRAGANDNVVDSIEWPPRSVGMKDVDLRPRRQRDSSAVCEGFVDLDGGYATMRTDKFGEDGRIVAGATTKMKNRISRLNVEQAQVKCPKAGLPIVQVFIRIQHDKRVFVKFARIRAFSEGLRAANLDQPRARPCESFAGHGRKCSQNCWR